MPNDPNLLYGATMVPVKSVERSVAFYTEVMGFSLLFRLPDNSIATVKRGPLSIQLQQSDDAESLAVTGKHIAIYTEVKDIDALWAELEPRLSAFQTGTFRAPFTQPYGMREFHVKDPDGMLMFFGADAPTPPEE